ncbi:MAG TPA: hypothetical protein ACYCC8_00130 [Candidatus Azoamicus sp.]
MKIIILEKINKIGNRGDIIKIKMDMLKIIFYLIKKGIIATTKNMEKKKMIY